jgi:hypothetical protein
MAGNGKVDDAFRTLLEECLAPDAEGPGSAPDAADG